MKTLITAKTFLGGVLYRVTGDKDTVNIQKRKFGCVRWNTIRTMSRADFDAAADDCGLYDPYRQDPALLRDIGETFFNIITAYYYQHDPIEVENLDELDWEIDDYEIDYF